MNAIRELYTLLQGTNTVLGANLQDVYRCLREANRELSNLAGRSIPLQHLLHHRHGGDQGGPGGQGGAGAQAAVKV